MQRQVDIDHARLFFAFRDCKGLDFGIQVAASFCPFLMM